MKWKLLKYTKFRQLQRANVRMKGLHFIQCHRQLNKLNIVTSVQKLINSPLAGLYGLQIHLVLFLRFLTVYFSIFISVINQLDAQQFVFQ